MSASSSFEPPYLRTHTHNMITIPFRLCFAATVITCTCKKFKTNIKWNYSYTCITRYIEKKSTYIPLWWLYVNHCSNAISTGFSTLLSDLKTGARRSKCNCSLSIQIFDKTEALPSGFEMMTSSCLKFNFAKASYIMFILFLWYIQQLFCQIRGKAILGMVLWTI